MLLSGLSSKLVAGGTDHRTHTVAQQTYSHRMDRRQRPLYERFTHKTNSPWTGVGGPCKCFTNSHSVLLVEAEKHYQLYKAYRFQLGKLSRPALLV